MKQNVLFLKEIYIKKKKKVGSSIKVPYKIGLKRGSNFFVLYQMFTF